MGLIQLLKDSRTSRFSPLVAVAYELLVGMELFFERILDSLLSRAVDAGELDEVTAVIKTFERPKKLKRLVKSIKRLYPGLKIIVVDDSRQPQHLEGVETIVMPYDSGVSAGRNAGLAAVSTRYMLCLDDDFVFNRHTDLLSVYRAMQLHPEIDLLAGEVVYLPLRIVHNYSETPVFRTEQLPLHEPGSYIGDYRVHLKVPNFYLGRTEKIRLVGWDKNLKRLDHADFFTRAVGVLTSAQDRRFRVLHYPTYFNQTYMERKNDTQRDGLVLHHKYHREKPKSGA